MAAVNLPIEEFGERHPLELSGGQQRRLAIAGIIALDRDVVLFDEPTAGLDGHARYEVLSLMKTLASQGKTVLFSTHQKDEALFADREIRVENGSIIFDSHPQTSHALPAMSELSGTTLLEKLRKTGSSLSGENRIVKSPVEKLHPVLRLILFLTL